MCIIRKKSRQPEADEFFEGVIVRGLLFDNSLLMYGAVG